jgi:hypothetical protein
MKLMPMFILYNSSDKSSGQHKIFIKVATIRLNSVTEHVVRPSQTAFMQGRHILDGVVTLHETVHEMHRKKLNGVTLKIDFEKTYGKVKWPFLQQTLKMKGFSQEWHALINNFVFGGSVAIKVNDDSGRYFQTKKGLRKGIPFLQCYLTLWRICLLF